VSDVLAASLALGIAPGATGAAWLFVPVLGPIGFMAATSSVDASTVALLTMDSVAQAAGVAMFIAGFLARRTMLVPDRGAAGHRAGPARWALRPGAPGAMAGISLGLVGF
jgi:hypothetical protein